MDLKDYIRRLDQVRRHLRQTARENALVIAHDAKALVKKRVQSSGTNSEGQQFAPYNTAYAKYGRNAKGYQSEYVDFTRTGRMLGSLLPRVVSETDMRVIVEVVPRDDENRRKLAGQFKTRGNILALSTDEIKILNDTNARRIKNEILKILP